MSNFRLLSRTRQGTEYTCGPSALQAVLRYWGREVEESRLAKLLKTTSAVGTYPEAIAGGARSLGFWAEAKDGLTLDEVRRFTAKGHPMIALAQVWRSQKTARESVEDEWDSGHYIVVLGVDRNNVYFQDPYVLMSKAFVPRKVFEAHWHHSMGGDVENEPKLRRVGIFIRGDKPAKSGSVDGATTAIDFRKLGSLNLIVMQFAGYLLPYDFMTELRGIWASGQVRPNAFILLRKDKSGAVSGMQGGRVEGTDDVATTNALFAAIASQSLGGPETAPSKVRTALDAAAKGDFGLSASDIKGIARKLPRDHSAVVVLVENVWERKLRESAAKYKGAIVSQRLVSSAAVAKAMSKLTAIGRRTTGRR